MSGPGLREQNAELWHRYRWWRSACLWTWLLVAVVLVVESR